MNQKQTIAPLRLLLLSMASWVLIGFECLATDTQTLISKSLQTLATGAGSASQASAYNPARNEFIVIYTASDVSCPSNQELKGQIIDAATGQKTGSALLLTSSTLPCGTRIIKNPQIVFNSQQGEYFIVFNLVKGLGSTLMYMTVNATNNSVTKSPTEFADDEIADPFRNWVVAYDASKNIYLAGYHKEDALQESTFTIRYISGTTKALNGYSTIISKSNFTGENMGVFGTQLLSYGSQVLLVTSTKFTSGSEIHGVFINSQTGALSGNFFKISPAGSTETNYQRPSAAYNPTLNEVFLVYEEVYAFASNAALNKKIMGQRILGSTGNVISPINQALTELPGTLPEDTKMPVVQYSALSKEYLVHLYGVRFTAGTDTYNNYLQRVNAETISPIGSPSTVIATSFGSQVVQNNSLKPLALAFNSKNNQFLLGWNTHTSNNVYAQVWRYDNNLPSGLALSPASRNENHPIGAAFATLTSSDPDPEDSAPVYSLVSGTGSQDNSFFTIVGNELRVAKTLNYEGSPTRSIRVRVTDSHGGFSELNFTLTLNNINEKPYSLALSGPLTFAENTITFTSNITVQDEDIGDTQTLSLIAGDSATHNANFTIDGAAKTLKLTKAVDFETAPKQFVRIRSMDSGELFTVKGFVITVTDVNEPPTGITITPQSFNENDAVTASTVTAIDQDLTSNYSYTLVPGSGDTDNDLFNLTTNKLKPKSPLNYELRNSYSIRVRAWDGVFEKIDAFNIVVIDKNDAPDSITLSSKTVMDGQGVGFPICKINTHDQDASDTHTLSLLIGSDKFFIDNQDSLITKTALVYDDINSQNNQIPIRIQSMDKGGAVFNSDFIIEVVPFQDTEAPEIRNSGNPVYSLISDSMITYSIDATDNEKLDTAYFFYRGIRSAENFKSAPSILIEKTNDQFFSVSVSINTTDLDELGLEYLFVVADVAKNTDSLRGYTYRAYTSLDFDIVNEKYDGDLESYKIITNPYALETSKVSKIFADYGSSGKNSWRLYKFDNDENIEIGSSAESMKQGAGYWFNKMPKTDKAISFDNPRVNANNRNALFEMRLDKGWNMIGNPYPFTLKWNEVMQYNDLESNELKFVIYSKAYSQSNALDRFEGGFVFAETSMDLEIPLINNSTSGNRIAIAGDAYEWILPINIEQNGKANLMASIGMHAEANESYDRFDIPSLPKFIDGPEIAFRHPEHFTGSFVKDIAPGSENHVWEFDAFSSVGNENITITWDESTTLPPLKKLVLYDLLNDRTIDMTVASQYNMQIDGASPFKILYGDKDFISTSLDRINIETMAPYPNPFTNAFSIPVFLPPSANPYDLELTIFNLMGERQFFQKIQGQRAGMLTVTPEDGIQNFSPGIYIYSITIHNGFLTKKYHGRIMKN
ncbi:MAG: hypothetical protein U5K79_09520 [Cyclobacteriaceae bacterium]|nr:hypothetical protein [Cyclobacteriaceae bacterium]